jgi:hypothetical protein
MPGALFGNVVPSYEPYPLDEGRPAQPDAAGSHTTFIVWLVVIGVIIPALLLGGLRAGGFQFVFKRR